MGKRAKRPHTYLFTVHLWLEELGNEQSEWRGKVKNIATDEERYFREWAVLGQLMQAMLPPVESTSTPKPTS
ncbi:MAG: hypothetical protein U0350_43435 [Caldilineaceae bacterium]